jgi:Spy/CpxP family protein refolding chaperone
MKTKRMRTVIAGLVAVAFIAAGANAFAGKGMGKQDTDQGYGSHHRKGNCAYGQMNANLTPEQREQMDAERQAFFNATKKERQDLYAKRLELRAEMAKSELDGQKALALQKEISAMQASLDIKRLEHIMAMRKINPDAGRGFMMGDRGMGHGGKGRHGGGQGMGYGPQNCPNE